MLASDRQPPSHLPSPDYDGRQDSCVFHLGYVEEELKQLEKMYRANDLREETEEALTLPVYEQRYAWFFAGGFALLAVQMVIGQYRRPATRPRWFLGWLRRKAPLHQPEAPAREASASLALRVGQEEEIPS